jgi:hypothetical protein
MTVPHMFAILGAVGAGGGGSSVVGSPEVWLDASDYATLTVDGSDFITQWDDKSGNGRNFIQYSARNCAKANTRTQNGLNVADFSTTPNGMAHGGAFGTAVDVNTNKQVTLQMVFAIDETTAGAGAFYWGADTNSFNYFLIERRSGTTLGTSVGRGLTTFNLANLKTRTVPYTTGTFVCITALMSTSGLTVRINGVGQTLTTEVGTMADADFLNAGPSTFRPKIGVNGSDSLDGAIAEVVFYNTVLGSSDYQANETYLMDKWGL